MLMPAVKKYIFVNGILKKNPEYVEPVASSQTYIPVAQPVTQRYIDAQPIAIISSPQDIESITEITHQPMQMSASTAQALENLQYTEIDNPNESSIDSLGALFTQYDIPLGLLYKLNLLKEYGLDFIIDDSASMTSPSNVHVHEASESMRPIIQNRLRRATRPTDKMNRLEEAENRLHVLIDILSLVSMPHIQIRFLNSPSVITLKQNNMPANEFKQMAHQQIRAQFSSLNLSGTPVQKALEKGFQLQGRWCHYLMNDGAPNEGSTVITQLITNRRDPQDHPLTLLSCSDNERDTAWMKAVDEQAPYVAEVDDYDDEKTEVLSKQGSAFPYTKGLWLLSQLVAAISPHDLDALDENIPFTKYTFDELLGRIHSPQEYQYYFVHNPNAFLYEAEYARFLTEPVVATQIISRQEQLRRENTNGYQNGLRPNIAFGNIAPRLEPITQQAMQSVNYHYQPNASTASGHSHGFFPPAPPAYQPPPSYAQAISTSNPKMGMG